MAPEPDERFQGRGSDVRLAELDRMAVSVLSGGRADMATESQLDELLGLDFRGHPWAELVVAAALVDRRDERANALVASSLRTFQRRQDRQGIGYAEFVKANAALIKRRLSEAACGYQLTREYLGPNCPVDAVALAQIGLAAYERGELREAIAITEEALALARLRRARRYEGQACLYLSFFALITGSFGRVDTLLDVAEEVYRELGEPMERVELPLVLAARGVLAALRGQADLAEEALTAALVTADELQMPPLAAIPRILRAEFTAAEHPSRSVADARQGLDELIGADMGWWQTWALRAQAVAAREAGDLGTSAHMLKRLLDDHELNPLERGFALLRLGETLVRTDDSSEAISPLEEARDLLEQQGARYWVARCWMALAEAGPLGAAAHRRAVAQADDDLAYRHLLIGRSALRITMFGDAGVWQGPERIRFPTHNAELAVFALALAGLAGVHQDVLMDRLWPEAPADRVRAQLRTLVWQVRTSLGREAWRLERRGHTIHLDLDGVAVDVVEARATAEAMLADEVHQLDTQVAGAVVAQLSQPLLVGWQYEPWVALEVETNNQLADDLAQRPHRR